jgi:hypothetical protein
VTVQSIILNEGAVLSSGTVEVVAFDNDGDGRVDPLAAPAIKTQPQSQSVAGGGASVTFSIVAAGNPSPSEQWRKKTTPIAGATMATISLVGVQATDAGTYKVTVANGAGSLTSDEVILFVVPPRGIRSVGHYGYGRRGGWHRYGHKHVELHRRPGGVGLAGAVAERR